MKNRDIKISPQTLGLDFDGVIGDTGRAFLQIACDRYGFCDLQYQNMTDFFAVDCTDIPEDIISDIFKSLHDEPLASGLQPAPGALEALRAFAKRTRPVIITARSDDEPLAQWLKHYLDTETFSRIDTIAMTDHDNKVPFCRERGITHFIDDRGETCRQMEEAGITPILFRQPWNREYNEFTTVESWQDILGFVENL